MNINHLITFQNKHSKNEIDENRISSFLEIKSKIKNNKIKNYFSTTPVLGLITELAYFPINSFSNIPAKINIKNCIGVFDEENHLIQCHAPRIIYNKILNEEVDPEKLRIVKEIESSYNKELVKQHELVGLLFMIYYFKLLSAHKDIYVHTFDNPASVYISRKTKLLVICSPKMEYKNEYIHG
jgi:hypothetical protein